MLLSLSLRGLLPEPSTRNSRLSTRASCSQQPGPGAGSCHLCVGAWGRMDAVRERSTAEPSAGWAAGAAGTPGAPIPPQPACPQNGSSGLKTGGEDTPAALGTPQGRGGWMGSPCKAQGVLSPAPCHPGALGVALVPHGAPQHCHPCTGDTVQVSQSGGGHCAGVTATPAQGEQCQGYSNGLTATPVWESAVPGSLSHLCGGQ